MMIFMVYRRFFSELLEQFSGYLAGPKDMDEEWESRELYAVVFRFLLLLPFGKEINIRNLRVKGKKNMKNTKRIAVLILCTVMCLCFVGCGKTKEEEYLPKLEHMESELNDALAALFEGTDVVGRVQSFEITDQNESTHDKSFYCDALNASLMVTGLAKDGKVIQIQTILLIDKDKFDFYDDDERAAWVVTALFPASIFDPNIETLADYRDIILGLEEVDDSEFNGDSMRYVSGDIEYAMISGFADSMAIISFNIRYLPAFPGGYFDDTE